MSEPTRIEYRVRPVTRFIVTVFRAAGDECHSSAGCGEFDNEETAYAVGYALAKAEHDRLGWPIADERIQYPTRPSKDSATRAK